MIGWSMSDGHHGGAREFLASRLNELHDAAGAPPLDAIAARAMRLRPPSARWRITGKRISDWKRGHNAPASKGALAAVVRTMIDIARTKAIPGNATAGLFNESQWQCWWAAARAEPVTAAAGSASSETGLFAGRPLSEVDPFELEVHAAIDSGAALAGLDRLPTYIRREHDDWLAEVVAETTKGLSMLAVLVGNSSTGKTRACWEAVQRLPPWWRLWHPIRPSRPEAASEALRKVGPHTVVWLNEINHYLLTPGSGDGEHVAVVLRELLRSGRSRPVLILGTIWSEYWAELTTEPETGARNDPHRDARQLLVGSSCPVPEHFIGQAAAVRLATRTDPRLAEAFRSAENGRITQYLAGVPVLLERYINAPDAARALIESAMDARRLGHGLFLPQPLLEESAQLYLSEHQWDSLEDNWLNDALAYTAAPCRGVRGPLTRVRPRVGQPHTESVTYRLADYLEQWGREKRAGFIPAPSVWEVYSRYAATSGDLGRLATEAQRRKLYAQALNLWTAAAEAGDESAVWQGAAMLREVGRVDEALLWYGRAAEAGYGDALEHAGRMLQEAGRIEEALTWYRRAADAGDSFALHQVVGLLVSSGRTDEALAWLADRSVSDIAALRHRAWILRSLGRFDQAVDLYMLATKAGDADSIAETARTLHWAGRDDEALDWYERATAAGDKYAPRQAARILREANRIDEALEWFGKAGDKSDTYAFREAAQMLQQVSRIDDAIVWYQRAIDAGDAFAAGSAAPMLERSGRVDQALAWYGDAASDGEPGALKRATSMLIRSGRFDDAIVWLQGRAEKGDSAAFAEVITMLTTSGRRDEALEWLKRLAQTEHKLAISYLIGLLEELGQDSELIEWHTRVAQKGDTASMIRVAQMLCEFGQLDESLDWYMKAAEAGDVHAMHEAVRIMQQSSRDEEAISWLIRLAEAGNRSARRCIARTNNDAGQIDEALFWYRQLAMNGDAKALDDAIQMLQRQGRLGDAQALRREIFGTDNGIHAAMFNRVAGMGHFPHLTGSPGMWAYVVDEDDLPI